MNLRFSVAALLSACSVQTLWETNSTVMERMTPETDLKASCAKRPRSHPLQLVFTHPQRLMYRCARSLCRCQFHAVHGLPQSLEASTHASQGLPGAELQMAGTPKDIELHGACVVETGLLRQRGAGTKHFSEWCKLRWE